MHPGRKERPQREGVTRSSEARGGRCQSQASVSPGPWTAAGARPDPGRLQISHPSWPEEVLQGRGGGERQGSRQLLAKVRGDKPEPPGKHPASAWREPVCKGKPPKRWTISGRKTPVGWRLPHFTSKVPPSRRSHRSSQQPVSGAF